MDSSSDLAEQVRSRRQLAEAMADYAMGCKEADIDDDDSLAFPLDLFANEAEIAIAETITAAEITLTAGLAAVQGTAHARTPGQVADLYSFAATCAEIASRQRPDVVRPDLVQSVWQLARRYGAYRTPPRCAGRARGTSRARRSVRRCPRRARSPGREPEPEPEHLGRLLSGQP